MDNERKHRERMGAVWMRRGPNSKLLLRWLFIIVASFGGTWAMLSLTPQSNTEFFSTNSIFSLLLFLAICWVLKGVSIADRRKACICTIFAGLLCVAIVFGYNLQLTGWPEASGYAGLGEIATYVKILFLTPLAAALTMRLVDFVDRIAIKSEGTLPFSRRKYFLIAWGIIFLCWVPWLLIAFPGICGYDSAYQIAQIVNDIPVTTHHPPLHTLILGGFVNIGLKLFGSRTVGFAIYSIFQMLVMAACCSFCCCTLRYDLKTGQWIARLAGVFFALFPVCAIFSMSATKDVLFAGAVLVSICLIAKLAFAEEPRTKPWRSIWALAIALLLALLLRNNMLAALLLSAPFLIVLMKGMKRKVMVSSLSVAIVGCLLATGVLYPALGVEAGQLQGEMYSVPLNQLSRTLNSEDPNLTPEEKAKIKEMIPLWNLHTARNADQAEKEFDKAAFEEDLLENIWFYVRVGLKNPSEYTNLFLDMSAGYWFPGKVFRDKSAYHPYILWDGTYGWGHDIPEDSEGLIWVDHASPFPALDEFMAKVIYDCDWQRIPVLSLLFSPGFILWCWLFVCAFLIYKKRYMGFVALVIPLMFDLTNLFGPVVQPRYAFIIFLALPLVIGILFSRERASYAESDVTTEELARNSGEGAA